MMRARKERRRTMMIRRRMMRRGEGGRDGGMDGGKWESEEGREVWREARGNRVGGGKGRVRE